MTRWLQEAGKKRGEQTGPSSGDRGTWGTALHLACAARARPLGVIVPGAKANDGGQTENVWHAWVSAPPAAASAVPTRDSRDFPRVQAEGAYGNGPTQEGAERAGFRLHAPKYWAH